MLNNPGNIQYADAQKKIPFGYFFFRSSIPVVLFPETLLAAPKLS